MSADIGILAYGGYVPQFRLRRGAMAAATGWANPALRGLAAGERAVANWDEDSITMAVEAARDALADRKREDIGGLVFASTSAPFADRLNAGVVAGGLCLSRSVFALDVGGSQRAGIAALLTGAALARSGGYPVLVAAAEERTAKPAGPLEFANGDAGAAVLIGAGTGVLARILAAHSVTNDFVGHWRSAGQRHDYQWEERWVREQGYARIVPEAVGGALAAAGLRPTDVTSFILPSPLRAVESAVAKTAGIPDSAVAQSLGKQMGFAGCAQALLMLARALETARPGDRLLVAGFGNGCDAVVLEATGAITDARPKRGVSGWLAQGEPSDDYLRYLSFKGEVEIDWGPRAEFGNKFALTAEYRASRDTLGFVGGRDRQTGVVQFPKTPVSVAPGAGALAAYDDVSLAELPARVVSMTADWLTYHPSPPFYFGLVQFDNGARVMMEFVDVRNGSLAVGASVTMMFRIKEIDRNRAYRHYFWKATPAGRSVRADQLQDAAE